MPRSAREHVRRAKWSRARVCGTIASAIALCGLSLWLLPRSAPARDSEKPPIPSNPLSAKWYRLDNTCEATREKLAALLIRGNLSDERRTSVLIMLGRLRPHDSRHVRIITSQFDWRPALPQGVSELNRLTRMQKEPEMWVCQSTSLPAVPFLVRMVSDDNVELRCKAVYSLSCLLKGAAIYWVQLPDEGPLDPAYARVEWALGRFGDFRPPMTEFQAGLFPKMLPPYEEPPDVAVNATLDEVEAALDTDEVDEIVSGAKRIAGVRRQMCRELAEAQLTTDQLRELVPSFAHLRPANRNLIRVLVEALATETLDPYDDLALDDHSPAFALAYIGLPAVPSLILRVKLAEDRQERDNAMGTLCVMLGRYARPWLEDVRAVSTTEQVQWRIGEALHRWDTHLIGEGLFADEG